MFTSTYGRFEDKLAITSMDAICVWNGKFAHLVQLSLQCTTIVMNVKHIILEPRIIVEVNIKKQIKQSDATHMQNGRSHVLHSIRHVLVTHRRVTNALSSNRG